MLTGPQPVQDDRSLRGRLALSKKEVILIE